MINLSTNIWILMWVYISLHSTTNMFYLLGTASSRVSNAWAFIISFNSEASISYLTTVAHNCLPRAAYQSSPTQEALAHPFIILIFANKPQVVFMGNGWWILPDTLHTGNMLDSVLQPSGNGGIQASASMPAKHAGTLPCNQWRCVGKFWFWDT